jgi:hypothetical protein
MYTNGDPFARFAVSIAALLVVGVAVYVAVVRGGTIDAGTLVYAIPAGAIAFAILATVGYRIFAPGVARDAPTWRRGNPMVHLIVCTAGLLVVGALYFAADADARAFAADPSCAAGLSSGRASAGGCGIETARVVRSWSTHHRSSTDRHVELALSDGRDVALVLGRATRGDLWDAVRSGTDRQAIVQAYRGRIVWIATASGGSNTNDMPSERSRFYFFLAIAFAAGGFISAFRLLLAP